MVKKMTCLYFLGCQSNFLEKKPWKNEKVWIFCAVGLKSYGPLLTRLSVKLEPSKIYNFCLKNPKQRFAPFYTLS